jgi:hypothetical protein
MDVELGDGKKVKARPLSIWVKIEETEAPARAIIFKGAKRVIGGETLES